MVGNLAVQPQVAKPPIGQVEVDLLAPAPFGPDAHAVAHDQHPHHQLRIDRGAAEATIEGLQKGFNSERTVARSRNRSMRRSR